MGGSSVFISYRRQLSETLALLIREDLSKHKFDTFVDVRNLDSGEFEQKILGQIKAREHFIVLLEPGSLDRIGEKGDWLRREIAHALTHGRNVVPVTAKGFEFPREPTLPPDVARLPSFQAVDLPTGYYPEALKRLRKRFLKTPSRTTAPPLPETRSLVTPDRQAQALQKSFAKAWQPSVPQLTGQVENPTSGFLLGNPRLVRLTWSEVSGANEYVLERAYVATNLSQKGSFKEVYRGPDQSYHDTIYHIGMDVIDVHYRACTSSLLPMWSDTLKLRIDFKK